MRSMTESFLSKAKTAIESLRCRIPQHVYNTDWHLFFELSVAQRSLQFKMADHENIVKQHLDLPLIRSYLLIHLWQNNVYTRFQCYVHRRHLHSSFDMLFKRLFNCETGNFSYY